MSDESWMDDATRWMQSAMRQALKDAEAAFEANPGAERVTVDTWLRTPEGLVPLEPVTFQRSDWDRAKEQGFRADSPE
jgi:hypothetical protein